MRSIILTTVAFLLSTAWLAAQQNVNATVKVTPLGSKTGEFCFYDRAMIFEDPTGVRILYNPGFTVAGSTDPRLGKIDVTLLSHAHADHIGTGKQNQNPDDTTAVCSAAFPQTPTVPNSNFAEITAEKHAVFVGHPALAPFIGAKMQAVLETSVGYCGGANNSPVPVVVPLGSSCLEVVNFGGRGRWSAPAALSAPTGLEGLRTMFAAFHHFGPGEAAGILQSAVVAPCSIAIFEATSRSVAAIASSIFIPLLVLLLTPAIRPVSWRQLVFTYFVPILPVLIFWDGLVSHLRTYTTTELESMTSQCAARNYRWTVSAVPMRGVPDGLPYLIGMPLPGEPR